MYEVIHNASASIHKSLQTTVMLKKNPHVVHISAISQWLFLGNHENKEIGKKEQTN